MCLGLSVTFSVAVLKIYWPLCSHDRSIAILLPSAGGSVPVYNIHVKLDVVCCKKRGEHVINIALAIHIPVMMNHTAL
jgi:hypothetical protein